MWLLGKLPSSPGCRARNTGQCGKVQIQHSMMPCDAGPMTKYLAMLLSKNPGTLTRRNIENLPSYAAMPFHSIPSCLFQVCPTCGAKVKVTSPESSQGALFIVNTRMSKKQIQLDCYGCLGPGWHLKKSAPPSWLLPSKPHLHMIQDDSRCLSGI